VKVFLAVGVRYREELRVLNRILEEVSMLGHDVMREQKLSVKFSLFDELRHNTPAVAILLGFLLLRADFANDEVSALAR
jgi:hypothetical protein